jgi:hypothetical protein
MQNEEMSNGEGQKKEVCYMTGACHWKRKDSISTHLPKQTFALGLNRTKNLGQGEMCA